MTTPWREAVIDALVVNHIYRKDHDADPRKAIRDLIEWEQKLALDPAVSAEAQALIDQGRREAAPDEVVLAEHIGNSEGREGDVGFRLKPGQQLVLRTKPAYSGQERRIAQRRGPSVLSEDTPMRRMGWPDRRAKL